MPVFLALALAAGQAATSAVPPRATLQARFDAASDAAAVGKCADAVAQFEAIERDGAARRSGLVAAAIAVRKGGCLIGTDRSDEGEAAIRRGLPTLEARGQGFAPDVRSARLALGDAALQRFDYAAASGDLDKALAVSEGRARVRPLLLLARLRQFDHDGRALALVAEAEQIVTASGFSKEEIAAVDTLHARILLNNGQYKEAYAELKDGLKKQGGLTERVTLGQVATRSDLAIAALLNRDRENARLYLAYTGAGRIKDTPFGVATQMDPPLCGEATGLKPADVAIVEFSLAPDGQVRAVSPIYTPGDRDVALAFARAVAGWSWRPEDAAKVPPFYRAATRVEVRCTTTGDRTGIDAPLKAAADDWFIAAGAGEAAWRDLPDARALPLQRGALTQATAAGEKRAALAAALALSGNSVLPDDQRRATATQAVELARALNAPAAVSTRAALLRGPEKDTPGEWRRLYRGLLAAPTVANDPLSAATLRGVP